MGAQANQPSADVPEDFDLAVWAAREALAQYYEGFGGAYRITAAAYRSGRFDRERDVINACSAAQIALADRQAREEARNGGGWRTIDSAPKDGRMFLGWDGFNMWPCVRMGDDPVLAVGQLRIGMMKGSEATHWMPLPAPPAIDLSPVEGDLQPWPHGCIKRSSCARNRACMYGMNGSCPHFDRAGISQEVDAEAYRLTGGLAGSPVEGERR